MQSFFRTFLSIAQLRQGPRDLPPSWPLLLRLGSCYLLTSILQSRWLFGPAGALTQGFADLTLTVAFFFAIAAFAGLRSSSTTDSDRYFWRWHAVRAAHVGYPAGPAVIGRRTYAVGYDVLGVLTVAAVVSRCTGPRGKGRA